TDYLDLYLLHWPSRYQIEETMAGLEDLVARGLVRYIGVSNFDVEELRDAMRALARERVACNQVLYNLGNRGIERELIPLCEKEGIAVVGYTPLHGGLPRQGSRRWQLLAEIGDKHRRTPRQVVLRFLTDCGAFVIPKASDPAHVRENADGAGFTL